MVNHIIVDGHNYIFQTGGTHAARDRDALIIRLAGLRQRRNLDVTVVFDNRTQPSLGCERNHHSGVTVIYARCGDEADNEINRLVEREHNKGRVTVVSTDEAHIGRYCRSMGAKVIGPAELAAMLAPKTRGRRLPAETDEGEKPAASSKDDIDYYLRKFQR